MPHRSRWPVGNLCWTSAANVTVAPSAGLALGSDETVGTLALAGTLSGTGHQLHTNGLTTLQAGALVSANLGAATVLVTGNSTLQGTASATTLLVSTGRLTLDGDGLLAGAPQVTVNSTGALALGGDETVGALTLAGTLDGTGTLTAPNVYFAGGRANANLGGGAHLGHRRRHAGRHGRGQHHRGQHLAPSRWKATRGCRQRPP
jgi:hypothetical protein